MLVRSLSLMMVLCSGAVFADSDVHTWVDADGQRHFGNPQFAPVGQGEAVTLSPANSMDAPDAVTFEKSNGPTFTKIKRAAFKNKRGWRGHYNRTRRGNPGRR